MYMMEKGGLLCVHDGEGRVVVRTGGFRNI